MANRDEIKRKKKKHKKQTDFTPFIIIGILAVVILAVVILSSIKPKISLIDPVFHKASITDGLTMGNPDAPVKVVEYADFQCPGCGYYWSEIEPTILSKYVETGKVFYTYSPFSFLGYYVENNSWDESVKSAEAAYCANDQGKFWEYRDYIFANQKGENEGQFSRDLLLEIANKLALDTKTFKGCLDSAQYYQTVMNANQTAQDNAIQQTPSFTVNGTLVNYNDLETTIEAALAQ